MYYSNICTTFAAVPVFIFPYHPYPLTTHYTTALKHTKNSQQPPMYCRHPKRAKQQPHAIARNQSGNGNTTPTGSRFAICPNESAPPLLKRHPLRVQARFISKSINLINCQFSKFFFVFGFCFFWLMVNL